MLANHVAIPSGVHRARSCPPDRHATSPSVSAIVTLRAVRKNATGDHLSGVGRLGAVPTLIEEQRLYRVDAAGGESPRRR
jgi:hypothetical protein